MARAVRWDLIADPKRYQRGFKEAERTTKQFHGFVTKTAGLIGGAFAAVQVGGFLKDAIGEAREAAKVGRQTAAVIKATGGAANVTAKDVDRLSTSLSNKVGVDDEVIAAGQNMLLTFKGVKNAAGDQNDVFNQATKVALDMTAALNQGEVSQSGLEQTTMRLGKALNDPIKGISALTRVGVTFTDAQKEQIKTLVESGKTMDAQKIILKELSSEFGGAAEAAADPWSRLTVVFGNVKEEIGTALLPAFEDAADWLSTFLPQAIDKTKEALKTAKKWWDENYDAIRALVDTFSADYTQAADDATASTDDLRTSAQKLRSALDDVLEWALRLSQGWDILAQASQIVSIGFLNIIKAGGKVINVVDRLSGGTGHAGDAFVNFADEGLTKAHRMLNEVREDAKKTQREIDRLHGKDVTITAKGVWVPPKGLGSIHSIVGATGGYVTPGAIVPRRLGMGGPLNGPGTETSDDIPAWLSRGEYVVRAKAVRAVGRSTMDWINAQGFAAGGPVGDGLGLGPKIQRSIDRLAAAIDRLTIKVPIEGANIPHVPGAWQLALSFLRGVGVPAQAISTFRPGARTRASGSVSYHALNRAVDLVGPDMMSIWQALSHTNPTELIYSRAPFYKSRRGWRPIGALDPITKADHYSHVHAAYDKGGWLGPGWTMAYNGTGRPERVLPPGAGGGPAVVVNVNVSGAVGNTREVADRLAPEVYTALKRVAERNGNTRLAAVLR